MAESRDRPVQRYAAAVAMVCAATLARAALDPLLHDRQQFIFFLISAIVVGRYAGFGPSLLTLFLGGLSSDYFFVPPRSSFGIAGLESQMSFAFYILFGLLCSLLMRSEEMAKRTAREAEERAKDSEARLLLALEAGRQGIWTWDLATNRVHSSETQAVIHGRSPDQTDTRIDEAQNNIHADDRHIVEDAIQRASHGMAPERVTYRVLWPDSSIHWVEAIGRVFHDASGAPNRVLGVCLDVTEKKLVEISLREAEERFRRLAVQAPVGIYQSDEAGSCQFVNQQWCEIARSSPEQALGYAWQELIHPTDRQRVIDDWQAAARDGKMFTAEYRYAPAGGEVRWISGSANAMHDAAGKVVGYIGTVLDITERKNAEDAVRISAAQLKIERELLKNLIEVQENEKQFICYEIHDGMIQYVAGSLMLLESYHRAHPEAEGSTDLVKIIGSLRRALDEGRRVIRGVRSPVLDDAGLVAAIGDLVDQVSADNFHVEFDRGKQIERLPGPVQTAIYRVVQEALTNAKKHSGSDRVRIELLRNSDEVHLEVADFGRGFNPHQTRKDTFGLTGMTERIRLLGGKCSIESEADVGTRVIAWLPVESAECAVA